MDYGCNFLHPMTICVCCHHKPYMNQEQEAAVDALEQKLAQVHDSYLQIRDIEEFLNAYHGRTHAAVLFEQIPSEWFKVKRVDDMYFAIDSDEKIVLVMAWLASHDNAGQQRTMDVLRRRLLDYLVTSLINTHRFHWYYFISNMLDDVTGSIAPYQFGRLYWDTPWLDPVDTPTPDPMMMELESEEEEEEEQFAQPRDHEDEGWTPMERKRHLKLLFPTPDGDDDSFSLDDPKGVPPTQPIFDDDDPLLPDDDGDFAIYYDYDQHVQQTQLWMDVIIAVG